MTGKESLKKILTDSRREIGDAANKNAEAQKFANQIANLNRANCPAFEAFSSLSGELADDMDSFPQTLDKQTFLSDYALSPASIRLLKTSRTEYFIEDGLEDGNVQVRPYNSSDALSRIDRYLTALDA